MRLGKAVYLSYLCRPKTKMFDLVEHFFKGTSNKVNEGFTVLELPDSE